MRPLWILVKLYINSIFRFSDEPDTLRPTHSLIFTFRGIEAQTKIRCVKSLADFGCYHRLRAAMIGQTGFFNARFNHSLYSTKVAFPLAILFLEMLPMWKCCQ